MPLDNFDQSKNPDESNEGTETLLDESFFYELGDQLHFDMGRRGGFCYGLACMTMQATLVGELAALKKRLLAIHSLSKEEIDDLLRKNRTKDHEPYTEKEIDILAFYEGVSLYQNVERQYSKLFKKYDWGEVGIAAGLIAPINLQDRYLNWKAQQNELMDEELAGPISSAFKSTTIFSKSDFIDWLTSLSTHLQTTSMKYPLSVCLNNYEHTIQLSFNPDNNRWTYTSGFNHFESENPALLADIIFNNKCFAKDDDYDHFIEPTKLVLTTEFFVPTQYLRVAKTDMDNWYANNVVFAIYNGYLEDTENEQASYLNELFYLAINSGNVSLLNNLITNDKFLARQSITQAYCNPFIIAAHTSCNPYIMIELSRSNFDHTELVLSEHPACKRAIELLQQTIVDNFLTEFRHVDAQRLIGHEPENSNLRSTMLWLLRDIGVLHQNSQLAALANETSNLIYQLSERSDNDLDENTLSAKLAEFADLAELSNASVENVVTRLSNELIRLTSMLDLTTHEDQLLKSALDGLLASLQSQPNQSACLSIKMGRIATDHFIKLIRDVSHYHSPEKQKTEELAQRAIQTHGLFQRRAQRDPRTAGRPQPSRTPTSKN